MVVSAVAVRDDDGHWGWATTTELPALFFVCVDVVVGGLSEADFDGHAKVLCQRRQARLAAGSSGTSNDDGDDDKHDVQDNVGDLSLLSTMPLFAACRFYISLDK